MRWLWVLLPVVILLIGAGVVARFVQGRPAMSDEERRRERLRLRRRYLNRKAPRVVVVAGVAGIAALVVGRWQIGLLMLAVGGGAFVWAWRWRNATPRD